MQKEIKKKEQEMDESGIKIIDTTGKLNKD